MRALSHTVLRTVLRLVVPQRASTREATCNHFEAQTVPDSQRQGTTRRATDVRFPALRGMLENHLRLNFVHDAWQDKRDAWQGMQGCIVHMSKFHHRTLACHSRSPGVTGTLTIKLIDMSLGDQILMHML